MKENKIKVSKLYLLTLLCAFGLLFSCSSSGGDEEGYEEYGEEEEKEHRGVDFLPPVKEYKDRASGAAAAVEGKGREVHRQFEMLDN